ncbi:Lanosterol 14-alpha-demethylase [Marasmius tenuissimus]|uniref:Lanosterol 14-alpha-demethylase n=1 Tax=Marasmius tenuissimus TaxID=585030 RepID=A0ABR3A5T3_9AGAR
MPLLTKIAKTASLGGVTGLGTFLFLTRKNEFVPMDPSNSPLFHSRHYKSWNPNDNATTHDDCMRKVPLDQIRPELLQKEGELVRAFVAGVWSSTGYAPQRAYLHKKYFGDKTKEQLWTPEQFKQSSYELGTQITDHFEVIERSPNSVLVRCGDSPSNNDREMDGIFELTTEVKREEGVAEFHMRTVMWQVKGKTDKPPMPSFVQWLHQQYDKLWMETGLWNVKR